MFELLKDYHGSLVINGKEFDTVKEAKEFFQSYKGGLTIILNKTHVQSDNTNRKLVHTIDDQMTYLVTVRKYMTTYDKSFFLHKMNHQGPMPYMTMYGHKLEETKGLVKMELWADISATQITTCMRCGRPLSNPISQLLGLGPECGAAEHMALISSGIDVEKVREEFRKTLQKVTWVGWIVKSAINSVKELPDYKKD
jgi:hypothetical protein